MAFRIAVYNAVSQRGLERLAAPRYAVAKAMPEADAILLRSHDLAVSEIGPMVKAIGRCGVGVNNIPLAEADRRGIPVFNAPGANANAVKELVLAAMLATARNLVPAAAYVAALPAGGDFEKLVEDGKKQFAGYELPGRTLGVIGLGAIGLRFAKMADALGMRVIGFDPFARNLPDYVQSVSLETIWREADAVSLHCPLTDENRGMLNAATLAQCKRGVIVVNTARGGLIDEAALLAAVRSGQVMAAGLDSFAVEPMVAGHPFQGEKNFILSPHIGGVTSDAYVNMGVAAAKNLLAVLARQGAPA